MNTTTINERNSASIKASKAYDKLSYDEKIEVENMIEKDNAAIDPRDEDYFFSIRGRKLIYSKIK